MRYSSHRVETCCEREGTVGEAGTVTLDREGSELCGVTLSKTLSPRFGGNEWSETGKTTRVEGVGLPSKDEGVVVVVIILPGGVCDCWWMARRLEAIRMRQVRNSKQGTVAGPHSKCHWHKTLARAHPFRYLQYLLPHGPSLYSVVVRSRSRRFRKEIEKRL